MAASATYNRDMSVPGSGGFRVETGTITFDSDATIELNTKLHQIYGASFVEVGDAGDANALSIDETATSGKVNVANGKITVDATGSNSLTYMFTLMGV